MTTVKIRFVGSEPCLSREVGAATGEGDLLAPGREYEVPRELADRLAGSSAAFEIVKTKAPKSAERQGSK